MSQILFLIIVVLIMVGTVLVTRNDGYQSRQYAEVVSAENVEKQRELTDHIVLDERANPWDNTVLIPLSEHTSFFELQLPIGAGIQYYYNVPEDKQTINEGWIILQEGDNVRQLQKAGFKSIYNKEGYVLMRKNRR